MDFTKLTPEQLNKMDKQVLITIIGSLQGQLNAISSQLNFLTEQIALMNQRQFGRKTERAEEYDQLSLFEVFNEPEVLSDDSPEPEVSEVIVSSYSRKKKTRREEKLEGLPARVFEHEINREKLAELFPNGYKELPVETYKRLSVIPQTFIVDEHRVHVYAAKNNDGTIYRAGRPADLFENSLATPSLLSTLMTAKFQNHLPVERQVQTFKASGVNLEANTLSNWMIKASDQYLSLIYDELIRCLKENPVIHADETPFRVIKNGKPDGGHKCYMWVYRNGTCEPKRQVVVYDFQQGRSSKCAADFLDGYSGVLVTDGYQVYQSLERKRDDLKVAGCWVHAKRKFAELVKAVGGKDVSDVTAVKAAKQISEIFHLDNQLDGLCKAEREKQRQLVVKPKVDGFFAWAKEEILKVPGGSHTYEGLQYCLNQEQYLRMFLEDGNVPMDNNRAEQAIRPFTLGRKNWVNVFSEKGAEASSVIYSLVETAKANNLRVYDYLELLLTELPKHSSDTNLDFLQDLLPWADAVQEKCHVKTKPQYADQYVNL